MVLFADCAGFVFGFFFFVVSFVASLPGVIGLLDSGKGETTDDEIGDPSAQEMSFKRKAFAL